MRQWGTGGQRGGWRPRSAATAGEPGAYGSTTAWRDAAGRPGDGLHGSGVQGRTAVPGWRRRRLLSACAGIALALALAAGALAPPMMAAAPARAHSTGPGHGAVNAPVLPGLGSMGPAGGTTHYPVTIRVDGGRQAVTIRRRPTRVVSLTLGTDEILLGLVRRARIAGLTSLSGQPSQSFVSPLAKGIEAFPAANAEQVLAARPDLVFAADYTSPGVVRQIEAAGIPVVEFVQFNGLSDVVRHIQVMGRILDDEARAQRMVQDMRAELARVQRQVRGLPRPSVLYDASDAYIAGTGTTVGELIRDAGGTNAAARRGIQGWVQATRSQVLALAPQVLLTDHTGPGDFSQHGFAARLAAEPGLNLVPAVRAHRVWGLSVRALNDVSEYMAWDVQDMASVLHPRHVRPFVP